VPDLAGRLPGRGLWLSARRDLVIRACEKRSFGRAARRAVANPEAPALVSLLERELVRRLVDGLGLARRAGTAVAGNEKLRGWLRGGMPRPERSPQERRGDGPGETATLLFVASDAAAGSRDKLLGQVRAAGIEVRLAACLDSAELGRAFGRERTVFAAVAPCRLGARLWDDVNRLSGFRSGPAIAFGDAQQNDA
jgi:hypothetical protein